MLSEGKVDHIEDIAEEIIKYENWEPNWDIQKNVMSASCALFLAGVGLLFGENSLKFELFIQSVTIGCAISAVVCFINIWRHHKENKQKYGFRARKLKDIMQKIRQANKD